MRIRIALLVVLGLLASLLMAPGPYGPKMNDADDAILESHLKAVDSASDEECLTYETTTGDFEWQSCVGAETNDLETDGAANIADTEVFIGTGAGTGNYAAFSGDVTLANDGTTAVIGVTGGTLTCGTSGTPCCFIMRDSDDGGDSACEVLNGTFTCETDTNGICGDAI